MARAAAKARPAVPVLPGARIAREILEAAKGSEYEAQRILEASRKFSTLIGAVAKEIAPFDFQAEVIDDWSSRLVHWTKPRQVGASFTMGAKAVSHAVSVPGALELFTSLSLEDAREKIEYAKTFLQAVEKVPGCPQIDRENVGGIHLTNGSRLLAVYYPRGKAKANLFLDEFAHHPNARKIYRASTPILILGGRLLMASTVIARSTLFSEIRRGDGGKYQSFKRVETRWWDSPIHCNDVALARVEAPMMEVAERVEKFGTVALKDLYDAMPQDDFLCEFELQEIGEEDSWLPWELILRCTPAADSPDHVSPMSSDEFIDHVRGDTSSRVYIGYDVGRVRDAAELSAIVVGHDGRAREMHAATFHKTDFDTQEQYITRLLTEMPRSFIAGDETGMGLMLFERLRAKFGGHRVVGINFSSTIDIPIRHRARDGSAKFVMALTLKDAMLNDEVRWQIDAHKNMQMHSVRREVTESLNMVFRVDHGSETQSEHHHHADVFWARAMAVWRWKMLEERNRFRVEVV
jgi:phage FluMu gp28-like protein